MWALGWLRWVLVFIAFFSCRLPLIVLFSSLVTLLTVWHKSGNCAKKSLKDTSQNYKEYLINLNLLSLMMEFEMPDVILLIKCVKRKCNYLTLFPSAHPIFVPQLKSGNNNNYFNCIPRLWNSLPRTINF